MTDTSSPLKYHMNDLVYYLGISTGGNLGKQISYLGSIAAMAKGMTYEFDNPNVPEQAQLQSEIDDLVNVVDMLERAYRPMYDTNQYLFQRARVIRKGVQIAEVLAFHIISKHNLIAGNIIRARMANEFGKSRRDHLHDDTD